jgi:hypothetical protein
MHTAVQRVEACSGQVLTYLNDLVRIPTVNPPGAHYEETGGLGRDY